MFITQHKVEESGSSLAMHGSPQSFVSGGRHLSPSTVGRRLLPSLGECLGSRDDKDSGYLGSASGRPQSQPARRAAGTCRISDNTVQRRSSLHLKFRKVLYWKRGLLSMRIC